MKISDNDKQWLEEAGLKAEDGCPTMYSAVLKDPETAPTFNDADVLAIVPKGLLLRAGQAAVVVLSDVLEDKYASNIVMYMPIDADGKLIAQISGAGEAETPKEALLNAAKALANKEDFEGWAGSIINAFK